MEQVETDKFGRPQSDWWCVFDYYETTVNYRMGRRDSIAGTDYFVYVASKNLARELWEKYNELQKGRIGGIDYFGSILKAKPTGCEILENEFIRSDEKPIETRQGGW